MQHKTFSAEVIAKEESGGQIRISTVALDRDRDRVMSAGAMLDNYLRNPVVQWGHGYYEPWQTIGRTTELRVGDGEIVASFELRPAANEADPQNVVRLLWDGGWVRTASIGFQPVEWRDNEFGGKDITAWELLEWSLVPIPANQDALRLAAKGLSMEIETETATKSEEATVVVAATETDAQEDAPTETAAADDAAAVEAANELRLAAILSEFVNSIRPYLATTEE